jgi:hypothetical protein
MNNQEKAIYAILADNVYWDVRSNGDKDNTGDFTNANWTPVPDGWTVIGKYDQSGSGSFALSRNSCSFLAISPRYSRRSVSKVCPYHINSFFIPPSQF